LNVFFCFLFLLSLFPDSIKSQKEKETAAESTKPADDGAGSGGPNLAPV
jgi:hypothetical protein